jgi:hypothetical protein
MDSSLGELSMNINGSSWNGNVRTINEERYIIIAEKYKSIDGISVPWEILYLALLDKNDTTITLHVEDYALVHTQPELARTYASFSTMQDDGDVWCDLYEVVESDSINNWVHITQQNKNFTEIWGEFSITLHRKSGCPSSVYPDTLRIKDGEFHIYLK